MPKIQTVHHKTVEPDVDVSLCPEVYNCWELCLITNLDSDIFPLHISTAILYVHGTLKGA